MRPTTKALLIVVKKGQRGACARRRKHFLMAATFPSILINVKLKHFGSHFLAEWVQVEKEGEDRSISNVLKTREVKMESERKNRSSGV